MIDKDITILLVDDDDVDMKGVRRSFRDLKITNRVVEARDGIEALTHLRGEEGNPRIAPPYLVLLDLNMPRMGGIEFLAELRSDPSLRRTLVFVLTTSSAEDDRKKAYEKNVAGYILKHRPGHTFTDTMTMLDRYWSGIEFPA